MVRTLFLAAAGILLAGSAHAADVNVEGFHFDIHNYRLHYWFPFPFLVAGKNRICTRLSLLMPFH